MVAADMDAAIREAEWALIEDTDLPPDRDDEATTLARQLVDADYVTIFNSDFAKKILRTDKAVDTIERGHKDLNEFWELNVEEFLKVDRADEYPVKEFQLVALGVACLHAFLQANYTGPFLDFDSLQLLPVSIRSQDHIHSLLLASLNIDGERPYQLIPHPTYLVLASALLNRHSDLVTAPWWRARVNFLHQRVLGDISNTIHNEINKSLNEVRRAVEQRSRDTQGQHTIEEGLVMTYYGQDNNALHKFKVAGEELGLEWVLTGALGRRTKFQTFDVSQLVVLAQGRNREVKDEPTLNIPRPETLELNDDTLLERIAYTSSTEKVAPSSEIPSALTDVDPANPTPLDPLDSTILLALASCIKNTNPADGLTMEEMAPYVARVLAHTRNWSVHTMALLLKTRLEHKSARTVQRSVLQLQALVDQLVDEISPSSSTEAPKSSFLPKPSDPKNVAPTRIRLAYAWQLLLPSIWDLEAELAQRWISLGALKTALEIFERLEMWDQVAICWAGTGRPDRASEVLRQQLEKHPHDAKLWCLLGDVEKNPEYWEKAWEVSRARYARAQRALGSYYFHRKDYSLARDAFELSLHINPLNHVAWFTLGCACLELAEYNEACQAFSRCVSLDPQDSESWSNLATGMLKLNRKKDAWHALKQATSGNYENWKIWQNYMYVSIDVDEFPDAIRSLKRVIDLIGGKNGEAVLDIEVMEMLVQRAVQDDPSEQRTVGTQVMDLFTKSVVPLITTSARLWNATAKLYLWRGLYSDALDANIKAFRTHLNNPGLETDEKVWNEAVDEAERLVDAYRNLGEKPGRMGGVVCKDWKYQARSALGSLKGRGKVSHEGNPGWDKLEGLLENLKN